MQNEDLKKGSVITESEEYTDEQLEAVLGGNSNSEGNDSGKPEENNQNGNNPFQITSWNNYS